MRGGGAPSPTAARPLIPRYLRRGIRERMDAAGEAFIALDEDQAREQLRILADCEVEGVAICLLNSYVNPTHEERLRELVAEELGDELACSVSSRVSPLAREYPRASTTVVDVLMKIIYGPYARALDEGLGDAGFSGELHFADCAAGLAPTDFALERPSRIVFSGPAAGTVACAHLGRRLERDQLLCADVGGTSCDLSVVSHGSPVVQHTFEIEHDLIVNTLSNEITSVGAGGGSIVSVTATGELRVGPQSAGADPGPACYGRGGEEPTLTDVCLLAGILDPERFAGGGLDVDAAQRAMEGLDLNEDLPARVDHAYRMGVNNLAEGLFNVLVKHGLDPRDQSLMAYGAAGPMLLPATLGAVGVKEAIVPPHAGLFSAVGLLSAERVFSDSRSAYTVLTAETAATVDAVYREMEEGLRERLGDAIAEADLVRSWDGQLVGQVWETPFVPAPGGEIGDDEIEAMVASFHDVYEERSGNRFETMPVQGVTYRVDAVLGGEKLDYPELETRTDRDALQPRREIELRHIFDEPLAADEYEREDLRAGDEIEGPAVVREPLCTTWINRGQVAQVGALGEIVITERAS